MENELRECKVCKEIKPLHTAFKYQINRSITTKLEKPIYYYNYCKSCAFIKNKKHIELSIKNDEKYAERLKIIKKTNDAKYRAKKKLDPNYKNVRRKEYLRYAEKNKEKIKLRGIENNKNAIQNLYDRYLLCRINRDLPFSLKLKRNEVTDELLNMVKESILYKRQISKQSGCSINKLNFS